MIKELQMLTPDFAGSPSHTHCFLHIVNLITKSLTHQFDAKNPTVEKDAELAALVKDLAKEEGEIKIGSDDGDEVTRELDNDEGWVDEMDNLTERERIKLEKSIWPVKLALVKVS